MGKSMSEQIPDMCKAGRKNRLCNAIVAELHKTTELHIRHREEIPMVPENDNLVPNALR